MAPRRCRAVRVLHGMELVLEKTHGDHQGPVRGQQADVEGHLQPVALAQPLQGRLFDLIRNDQIAATIEDTKVYLSC